MQIAISIQESVNVVTVRAAQVERFVRQLNPETRAYEQVKVTADLTIEIDVEGLVDVMSWAMTTKAQKLQAENGAIEATATNIRSTRVSK